MITPPTRIWRRITPLLLLTGGIGYGLTTISPANDVGQASSSSSTNAPNGAEIIEGLHAEPKRSATVALGPAHATADPLDGPQTANALPQPPIGDEALQREMDVAAPRDLDTLSRQGNLSFLDDVLPGFENGIAIETFEDWHPAKHAGGNSAAVPAPTPRPYFDPDAEP